MRKNAIFLPTSLILATITITGCARPNLSPRPTIDEQAKQDLAAPVNCATARQDIATLEDEKASVAKQIVSGVRSVNPFSAAAGIVLGDERDRVEVATGTYNEKIDAKISEIRRRCGLSVGEV